MNISVEGYIAQYGWEHIRCFCCDEVELNREPAKSDQWPICLRCSYKCPNYTPCASSERETKSGKTMKKENQ